jgi:hypothetical protein
MDLLGAVKMALYDRPMSYRQMLCIPLSYAANLLPSFS